MAVAGHTKFIITLISNTMTNSTPIHENNAIDEISFGLSFTQSNPDFNAIKSLINIEKEWEQFLPEYELTPGFGFKMKSEPEGKSLSIRHPGITRYQQSRTVPNRRKWVFQADSSQIVVACSEYSSWQSDSEKSIYLLKHALTKIEPYCTPVESIDFNCIDIFKGDESLAENIFNIESEYIPKLFCQKIDGEKSFDQRWISDEEAKLKFIHRLSIQVLNANIEADSNKEISITHNVSVVKKKDAVRFDSINLFRNFDDKNSIRNIFNKIHNQNKTLINSILNANMLKQIRIND